MTSLIKHSNIGTLFHKKTALTKNMNRETLIAILLGFTGGILVAFLLVAIPKRLPQFKKESTSPTPAQEQPQPKEEKALLDITSPEEGIVVEGEEIEISGSTKANTQVVVNGPSEDVVVASDESGSFSAKLGVFAGENLFTITAYPENENPLNKSLSIFATEKSS